MTQFVRLLKYLKPYWWQIAIGLLCLLLATPAQLFHPLVWKFIVDEVIVNHKVGLLVPALLVMVAVHLVGVGLSAARTYLLGVVGQRFVFDLRNELYRKLQSHSFRFFHERRSGDLIARVIGDVDTLQEVTINGVDNIIANALQFIGVAAIIVALNWKVGTLTLLPMAGVAALVWISMPASGDFIGEFEIGSAMSPLNSKRTCWVCSSSKRSLANFTNCSGLRRKTDDT